MTLNFSIDIVKFFDCITKIKNFKNFFGNIKKYN